MARTGSSVLLLFFLIFSCKDDARLSAANATKAQNTLQIASLVSGSIKLDVELARTDDEQRMGLMFRKELKDGNGMLFLYKSDRLMSFWMKNTSIPLSIAFLSSDGTIREIYDMEPLSLESVSSQRHVRYALEVPQGWFERVGLKVGDHFVLPEDLWS